jgi:hypothetical protein
VTRFISEFILDSDIRLPEEAGPLTWADPDEDFILTLENAASGFSFIEKALIARLIFSAENLSDARERCQDLLASILNSLVWATLSKVKQAELTRVVDWTPGKVMRDALVFHQTPKIAVSVPILIPEVVNSAAKLLKSQRSDRVQSALRWFRLGVSADTVEDQFTYFWFSVETAAEALKKPGKVTSKCPVCDGSLYCETCATHPLHRRFSADAIKDLIVSSFSEEELGRTTFQALVKVRHALMHGRRMETVLDSVPFDQKELVNSLAQIARNAIFRMSDFTDYEDKRLHLDIVDSDDVVRGSIIASVEVQTVFGPDPNNPTLIDRSGFKISVRYPGQPDEDTEPAAR